MRNASICRGPMRPKLGEAAIQISSCCSRDKFIKLHLHFHKTYGHETLQGADFREEVQKENA